MFTFFYNHNKTGNKHKPPANDDTLAAFDYKLPANDHKLPNGHPCTSNKTADVSFLLPTPGNFKDHPYFEKQAISERKLHLTFTVPVQSKQNRIYLYW